jgi:hypothetical protein
MSNRAARPPVSLARALAGVALGAALVTAPSACSSSDAAPGAGAGTDAGTGTGADAASAAGLRTLSSCTTDISADAPAFFRTYFRCVTITATADAVTITTDGLPPHKSNYWGPTSPNYEPFDTSRGAAYHANPNLLQATHTSFTVPLAPVARGVTVTQALVDGVVGTAPQEYSLGPVGVALDSVLMFNPLAAPGDDIEQEKYTFDGYDAHPTQTGAYHYHAASKGPLEVLTVAGTTNVELYGIMCDGTVVLGCTELDGSAPDFTSLDAQGGHVGDVKDGQGTVHFAGRYHTHICPSVAGARRFTPEIQYYSTCTR